MDFRVSWCFIVPVSPKGNLIYILESRRVLFYLSKMFRTLKSAKTPRGPWAELWRVSMYLPPLFSLLLLVVCPAPEAAVSFCLLVSRCSYVRKVPSRSTEYPLERPSGCQHGGDVWAGEWPGRGGEKSVQGEKINLDVRSQWCVLGTVISNLELPGFKLQRVGDEDGSWTGVQAVQRARSWGWWGPEEVLWSLLCLRRSDCSLEDALEGKTWAAGGPVGVWRSPPDCRWCRPAWSRMWQGMERRLKPWGFCTEIAGSVPCQWRDHRGRSQHHSVDLEDSVPLTATGRLGGEAVSGVGEEGWWRPKGNTSDDEIVGSITEFSLSLRIYF